MQLALAYERETQKDRVLRMFREAYARGEWLTNGDFCRAYLPNFRSRFKEIDAELFREGLHISDAEFVRTGVYRYRIEALKEA
jgi:predicted nicotinamide N-methyase